MVLKYILDANFFISGFQKKDKWVVPPEVEHFFKELFKGLEVYSTEAVFEEFVCCYKKPSLRRQLARVIKVVKVPQEKVNDFAKRRYKKHAPPKEGDPRWNDLTLVALADDLAKCVIVSNDVTLEDDIKIVGVDAELWSSIVFTLKELWRINKNEAYEIAKRLIENTMGEKSIEKTDKDYLIHVSSELGNLWSEYFDLRTKFRDFSDAVKENIEGYSGDYSEILQHAPALFELFESLLNEKLTPEAKRLVRSIVSYFVLPWDLIPEAKYGALGYLDDLYLSVNVINEFKKEIGEDFIRKCWQGKEDVFELASSIAKEIEESAKTTKESQVNIITKAKLKEVLDRALKP